LTGFFFHFANANVLLVLGELMGGENEDGSTKRTAIPLIAGAIVLAQFTMSGATYAGDKMTKGGWGRKPLFLAGLLTLPIRCFLIIFWKDAGEAYLLSTQILDGLGGGFFGLLHPYLVADITFGTGRFNVVMGLTASCFGLGGTLSNLLGQMVVEHFGHVASLTGSLFLSIIPIVLFSLAMPETAGSRGKNTKTAVVGLETVGVAA
jgi:MFS family permease